MPRDTNVLLYDILESIGHIEGLVAGLSFADYLNHNATVWAVERKLSIIGEAVVQLLKLEPTAAL